MELPGIFLRHARNPHYPPYAPVTQHISPQQAEQTAEIQSIAFRSARPAIDLNARGIHHVIGNPVRQEIAMQPEAVTSSLITTDHRCFIRQPPSNFRPRDFICEPFHGAGRDSSDARALPGAHCEAQLPPVLA